MKAGGKFYIITILLVFSTIPVSLQMYNHLSYLLRKWEELKEVRYKAYSNHVACFGNKSHLLFLEWYLSDVEEQKGDRQSNTQRILGSQEMLSQYTYVAEFMGHL